MFHQKIATAQKAGLIKIKIKTALPFGGAVFLLSYASVDSIQIGGRRKSDKGLTKS